MVGVGVVRRHVMASEIDDIAFLANSENRVEVLDTLTDAPRTRQYLNDHANGSRVTLGRILRDLEARNWIERTGHEYQTTQLGKWVCEEFTNLVEIVGTTQKLATVLQWFPTDLLTFDVQCLRDADIALRDHYDITGLVRLLADSYRTADQTQALSKQVSPSLVEATWQATVQGEGWFEAVVDPGVVAAVTANEEMDVMCRDMVASGNARLHVHEDIPLQVALIDDAVFIGLIDSADNLQAVLHCTDATIQTWAMNIFETYRDAADPVPADELIA